MKIEKASSKKQIRDFVYFPQSLYENNPCYVPPIWLDEKSAYNKKNNPILANSDFELFLLYDNCGNPIGRNLVYIDHAHNEFYKVNMGFFGAFECIEDDNAAGMLIKPAEDWLIERNVDTIRGPIHPVAENWGFVYDGYQYPPVYMSPWNPEYYHSFFVSRGYEKSKDLLVYEIDIEKGYDLPERYTRFYNKFMEHYPEITIRRIDMNHIKKDAKAIWEVTNISLKDNWGFVPVDIDVMEDILKKLKLIVDPDAVWIVEDSGKPIGYCLGFPDINIILKKISGKLLPFGWINLLSGVKHLRDYRLFGLAVHPEYHRMGLDALMYINLYNHLKAKNVRMEANYILEDNLHIKNSLEKLGMEYLKTYRIYDKKLT
ncbi:MAG: GNAT family N-acetyltransferase [Clostridia bacterium]|nr:GNAT family N-acetyltransferase [Clostridia bacterium]